MDISLTTEKRRRATVDIPSKRRNPDVLHPAPATWQKCSWDLARLLSNQSGSSPIRKSVQKKDKRAAGELQHGTEIRKTRVRQRREYHDEDTRGHWLPQFALSQESSHAQQALTARVLQFELSNSMPVPEYDLSTPVHPENPPESQADFNRPCSWDRDFNPDFDVLQSDKSSGDFRRSRGRLDQKALTSKMEAASNALTYGPPHMSPVRKWWIGDSGDGRPPGMAGGGSDLSSNKRRLTGFSRRKSRNENLSNSIMPLTQDYQQFSKRDFLQIERELLNSESVGFVTARNAAAAISKDSPFNGTVSSDSLHGPYLHRKKLTRGMAMSLQQREEQLAFEMKQVLLEAQTDQAQRAHRQQGVLETAPSIPTASISTASLYSIANHSVPVKNNTPESPRGEGTLNCSRKHQHYSSLPGSAEGNSVLIRSLEPNRSDIAYHEQLHPLKVDHLRDDSSDWGPAKREPIAVPISGPVPTTVGVPVEGPVDPKMMVKYTISEDHSQGLEADRIDKLRRFHGREKDYSSIGKRIEHNSGKASTSKISPGNLSQK